MDVRVSIIILFLALFVSCLCAIHNINVREVFGGTEPYQVNNWEIYLIARIASYVTSIFVSISFIRVISFIPFNLSVLETIGKDTLKYYMFHGLFLLAIEAVNAPWSSLFSILYATIVSIAIYYFNKTQLSNFVINPLSYIKSRIHSGQNNIEKNG